MEKGPVVAPRRDLGFAHVHRVVLCAVFGTDDDIDVIYLALGWRAMLALAGYLIMQVGLWRAEFKSDEEGACPRAP